MSKAMFLSLGILIVGMPVGWAATQLGSFRDTNQHFLVDYQTWDGKTHKGRSKCQKRGGKACIACCRAVKNPFGERRYSEADCAGHCAGH
jgi:hypothetical protein